MRHRSTELMEYLQRQEKVREEIMSLIEEGCDRWDEDSVPFEQHRVSMMMLAERWITVIRAICNVQPRVLEVTEDVQQHERG